MHKEGDFQGREEKFINDYFRANPPELPESAIELSEIINLTVTRALYELGFKGGMGNRVKRADMVRIIGRKRYDRAVENGELKVQKNGPAKSAGVWATRADWERFCKKYHY